MLGVDWLESSSAEEDLGVPMYNKMNMSLQHAVTAKKVNSLFLWMDLQQLHPSNAYGESNSNLTISNWQADVSVSGFCP